MIAYKPENGDGYEGVERFVQLHRLWTGTAQIIVKDLICSNCSSVNTFDGRSRAMFAFSSTAVFAQELLDLWIYHICAVGAPFIEAYEIYHTYSCSVSSLHGRKRLPSKMHRRIAADCFTAFLSLLEFPSDDALADLFSSATCETEEKNCERCLDAVVMDGTAVGVLKKLPKFNRVFQLVPLVNRCARKKFMLRTPMVRRLAESMFQEGARVTAEGNSAIITIETSEAQLKGNVMGLFFHGNQMVQADKLLLPRVLASINFVQVPQDSSRGFWR